MKKIVPVLFSLFLVMAVEAQENSKITVFKGSIESLRGPQDEIEEIKNFPFDLYQIHYVDKLGFFYLDEISDSIKNMLRWGYIWESHLVDIMKQHVKPGTVALDIGAHVGSHSISLSKMVGKGKVIAFEPQKKLFSEFVWNMVLNQCSNVEAYRCVLGKQKQQIQMNKASTGNEGGTGIGSGGDFAYMIRLDDLKLTNVSFIKLDVENSEDEVLLGAKDTLKKNKPAIIIEMQGNQNEPDPLRDQKIGNTHKLLNSMGYRVTHIWGDDWLALPVQ